MQSSVKILPVAWKNLKEIEDYYLTEFGDQTAIMVSNCILDVIERLEPRLGTETMDESLNELGFEMVMIKDYAVIFRQIHSVFYIYHIVQYEDE